MMINISLSLHALSVLRAVPEKVFFLDIALLKFCYFVSIQ